MLSCQLRVAASQYLGSQIKKSKNNFFGKNCREKRVMVGDFGEVIYSDFSCSFSSVSNQHGQY